MLVVGQCLTERLRYIILLLLNLGPPYIKYNWSWPHATNTIVTFGAALYKVQLIYYWNLKIRTTRRMGSITDKLTFSRYMTISTLMLHFPVIFERLLLIYDSYSNQFIADVFHPSLCNCPMECQHISYKLSVRESTLSKAYQSAVEGKHGYTIKLILVK